MGIRVPSLHLHEKGYFRFCSPHSCFNDFHYEINQKYHIVIKNYPQNSNDSCNISYKYQIEIDGDQKHSVVHSKLQEFENVKLYTSNPWHIPFTSDIGSLQNLQVERGDI